MSFLIAPTAAATMPYAIGTGFVVKMCQTRGNLRSSIKLPAIQVVCFAASTAFAALAATYGTMTAVGVTAGVGFAMGVGKSLWREANVEEGAKKRKVSHVKAGMQGVMFAMLAVFVGRVFNNVLGAAGQRVYAPLQPHVQPGIDSIGAKLHPYVQPGIDWVRTRTGI